MADAVVAHRRDAESELIRKQVAALQTAAQGKVWSTLWTFVIFLKEAGYFIHTSDNNPSAPRPPSTLGS